MTTDVVSADNTAAASPEDRLTQRGIILPEAPGPLGAYAPWAITGSLLMTSGQFPWVKGELAFTGRIGGDVTPEQGYEAYRLAALNGIAQMKQAVGSLSRVRQIVRLEGTMQVAPGYTDGPTALNGASDLFNDIFGARGRHTRMIYTNPEMPLNSPLLLVILAEVDQASS